MLRGWGSRFNTSVSGCVCFAYGSFAETYVTRTAFSASSRLRQHTTCSEDFEFNACSASLQQGNCLLHQIFLLDVSIWGTDQKLAD